MSRLCCIPVNLLVYTDIFDILLLSLRELLIAANSDYVEVIAVSIAMTF